MLTFKVDSVLYASCLGAKALKAKLFNNIDLYQSVWTLVDDNHYVCFCCKVETNNFFGSKMVFNEHVT